MWRNIDCTDLVFSRVCSQERWLSKDPIFETLKLILMFLMAAISSKKSLGNVNFQQKYANFGHFVVNYTILAQYLSP